MIPSVMTRLLPEHRHRLVELGFVRELRFLYEKLYSNMRLWGWGSILTGRTQDQQIALLNRGEITG